MAQPPASCAATPRCQGSLIYNIAAGAQVLHGAGNDVLWLQRDFHIYMVNCFDTAIACEV